jgi:hypothetical protein
VQLSLTSGVDDTVRKYLNRLSDFFFAAARWANYIEGFDEEAHSSDQDSSQDPLVSSAAKGNFVALLRQQQKTSRTTPTSRSPTNLGSQDEKATSDSDSETDSQASAKPKGNTGGTQSLQSEPLRSTSPKSRDVNLQVAVGCLGIGVGIGFALARTLVGLQHGRGGL